MVRAGILNFRTSTLTQLASDRSWDFIALQEDGRPIRDFYRENLGARMDREFMLQRLYEAVERLRDENTTRAMCGIVSNLIY